MHVIAHEDCVLFKNQKFCIACASELMDKDRYCSKETAQVGSWVGCHLDLNVKGILKVRPGI